MRQSDCRIKHDRIITPNGTFPPTQTHSAQPGQPGQPLEALAASYHANLAMTMSTDFFSFMGSLSHDPPLWASGLNL